MNWGRWAGEEPSSLHPGVYFLLTLRSNRGQKVRASTHAQWAARPASARRDESYPLKHEKEEEKGRKEEEEKRSNGEERK